MPKIAIITGITGQDGAYLAELLLKKGYKVYGTYRRAATTNFWRLQELGIHEHPSFELIEYDLTDLSAAIRMIEKIQPDEIYNLAAQSFVGISFDQPITTSTINGLGPLYLLEAIRITNSKTRFYQASTSEMFGKAQSTPQDEQTPFYPRSPYGISKLYAHWMTINYRESYNIFAVSGVLYNHESPLRGLEFVTRKITNAVAKIYTGKQDILELGNINSIRDWGYAKEYVYGMWLMMQKDTPDNYVLATGRSKSVRDFISMAFKVIDIELFWENQGENESGIDVSTGKKLVRINPKFYRPTDVDLLIGNAGKARSELGWNPVTTIEQLCQIMVKADLKRINNTLNQEPAPFIKAAPIHLDTSIVVM